jgi:hypothetical protein
MFAAQRHLADHGNPVSWEESGTRKTIVQRLSCSRNDDLGLADGAGDRQTGSGVIHHQILSARLAFEEDVVHLRASADACASPSNSIVFVPA